jgi:hypothetical protein
VSVVTAACLQLALPLARKHTHAHARSRVLALADSPRGRNAGQSAQEVTLSRKVCCITHTSCAHIKRPCIHHTYVHRGEDEPGIDGSVTYARGLRTVGARRQRCSRCACWDCLLHRCPIESLLSLENFLVALAESAFCIAAFVSAHVLRFSNVFLMFCLGACAACFAGHLFLTGARAI